MEGEKTARGGWEKRKRGSPTKLFGSGQNLVVAGFSLHCVINYSLGLFLWNFHSQIEKHLI
jgi:hypothetical protein